MARPKLQDPETGADPQGQGEVLAPPPAPEPDLTSILRTVSGEGMGSPDLPQTARESERPRLRKPPSMGGPAAPSAAPPRPSTPTPMTGSTSGPGAAGGVGMPPPGGVLPFEPLGGPEEGTLAGAGMGGLGALGAGNAVPGSRMRAPARMFGAMGGLQEGGLGSPFDPVADETSDPIETLLMKLMGGGGGY